MVGGVRTAPISIPGTLKSMPKIALPSTFGGTSTLGRDFRVNLGSLEALSVGFSGIGSRAASVATSPNVNRRPLTGWITALPLTLQVLAGTPQRAAAARVNISRAAAPVLR